MTSPGYLHRTWKFALAVCLAAYFLAFNWASLRVHFALDDISNIGHYYEYSPWQLVLSNFLPWRGDSRPMGGLYYIPIYHFAGLNPVPYQAVLLAILLVNVYLVYCFARQLGASEIAAGLAALASCYHGGIANLYYNAAFIFDAMCCVFYLAAFCYYLRFRNRGQLLGPIQTIVFLGLFLCALNSKEMAVSIPPMLLIYEFLYHPPKAFNVSTLLAWVRGPARMSLIAGVLDLADIYGKMFGPVPMISAESYHPVFTLDRLKAFQSGAMRDLFYSWDSTPGWKEILVLWTVLAALAWWTRKRPVLPLLFWFLVIIAIPIEFLPGKGQACLTLLMVGGAIFVAVVFASAVEWIDRLLVQGFGVPAAVRYFVTVALVGAALFIWVRDQRRLREFIGHEPMTSLGFETWDLIEQLRASDYRAKPGGLVVFTEDPFPNTYDMYFLARLWVHDRTVIVHASRQGPLPDDALAKADAVFAFHDRKLARLR